MTGTSRHEPTNTDASRHMLRHTIATLAYRAEKVLRDVPADVANLRPSPASRTPLEILAHMGDLMEWALRMTHGESRWKATHAPASRRGASARTSPGAARDSTGTPARQERARDA